MGKDKKFSVSIVHQFLFIMLFIMLGKTVVLADDIKKGQINDYILKNAIDLNSNEALRADDFQITSLNYSNLQKIESNDNPEAIRSTTVNDNGLVEVNTIIPYNIDENNNYYVYGGF